MRARIQHALRQAVRTHVGGTKIQVSKGVLRRQKQRLDQGGFRPCKAFVKVIDEKEAGARRVDCRDAHQCSDVPGSSSKARSAR
jgi:hypothetical protein